MIDLLFSVVVPVYNVEAFLEACLASLKHQSCQDFEIIIVNDGSSDSSSLLYKEFVAKNPQLSIKIVEQPNRGLLGARRAGFQQATGDYIVSLDGDDELRFDALEIIQSAIESSSADVVCFELSTTKDFSLNKNRVAFLTEQVFLGRRRAEFIREFCLHGKLNSMVKKAIRRSILDVDNDYSEFGRTNYGEDALQSLAVYDAARSIHYLPEALYYYRLNNGSITQRFDKSQFDDLVKIRMAIYDIATSWQTRFAIPDLLDCVDMNTIRATCAYCQRVSRALGVDSAIEPLKAASESDLFIAAMKNERARAMLRMDMRVLSTILDKGWYHSFSLLAICKETVAGFRSRAFNPTPSAKRQRK